MEYGLVADGADLAKLLRDDEVWLKLREQALVQVVYRAVPVQLRADGVVYLAARHRLVRDAARGQHGLAHDRRGKVALVRDADERAFEPERADYLSRRRQ